MKSHYGSANLEIKNNKYKKKRYRKNSKIKFSNLISFIFILGVFLKQFYIGASGSLQVGDMIMILPLFVILMIEKKIKINSTDTNIYIFFILSSFINIIHYIIFGSYEFIVTNIYMLYSLLMIYVIRYLKKYEYFYILLLNISKIIIILQLLIYSLGLGRYYGFTTRYMGTFNDPNQFGYFILTMILFMHLTSNHLGKKVNLIYIIASLYLIYLSESTGMLVGLLLFLLFNFIIKSKYKIPLGIFAILLLLIILVYSNEDISSIKYNIIDDRLLRKLDGVSNLGDIFNKFIIDRNLSQIIVNPFGFLYGTGEGYFERYGSFLELHSTMIGLLYYYGIIPYIFFLRWIKQNLEEIDKNNIPIAMSLIFTAFTIINHRQPFFWGLFILL